MKFKPLHDRVLVQRIEMKEQKKGDILIPDSAKETPSEGTVIAVGSGRVTKSGKTIPLDVKPGDRVLLKKYSGTEVEIEEKKHLILREDEVLGIIQ